jgi:hypothetical protein
MEIALYYSPKACSLVPYITLTEAGAAFETRALNFRKRQHFTPEYLKLNPRHKVLRRPRHRGPDPRTSPGRAVRESGDRRRATGRTRVLLRPLHGARRALLLGVPPRYRVRARSVGIQELHGALRAHAATSQRAEADRLREERADRVRQGGVKAAVTCR